MAQTTLRNLRVGNQPVRLRVATVGAGYTVSGPAIGSVGTASTFTATLAGSVAGTVTITPSASDSDGAFSPTSVALTNGSPSATFTYTPTVLGPRTIATTNGSGLLDPAPAAFVGGIQVGSSGTATSGNQAPDLGGFNFFGTGSWWQAIGTAASVSGVASNSSALLSPFGSGKVRIDWSTTTANGGNSLYGIPFNSVAGSPPYLPIEISTYPSESDSGPCPFFTVMSIEGIAAGSGVPAWKPPNDQHGIVMVRDETTGGVATLWEAWKTGWDSTNNCFEVAGLSRFNITTGAPRPEFWTSADAAGLPISPLLVNYDEAYRAAHGGAAVNHPYRCTIPPGDSLNAFCWPARHWVSSGSNTTGLPMGARLQLTDAWYAANIGGFDSITGAVVTALHSYGMIVADLSTGGLFLEGINDQRWTTSQISALAQIPVSAFQVLDTIKSPLSLTGPSSGAHGSPQTFTINYLLTGNSNFSATVYAYWSSDGGTTWTVIMFYTVSDGTNLVKTFNWTPASAGSYLLRLLNSGGGWVALPYLSFTAT